MARTSAKAKKSKQEVNKKKEEAKQNENKTDSEGAGDSTDKENDNLNYDVEKITHTRMFKGKRQYLIRWKGYSEDNDTWENESVLQSCKDVLDAFKKEHLCDENSDDEKSVKEDEKVKNQSKKAAKKNKKKKSGRSLKSKEELEDSQTASENEEEENANESDSSNINKMMKSNIKENTDKEDTQSDSDVMEEKEEKKKKKGGKGKKRNAAKETVSSKAKKAKKDADSDDNSITDGKDYEVEKIIEVHTRKDGSREFLIRWKGYKPSEDTWEPEAHLDCQELIEKFMDKVDKAKELTRKELRENRTQTKRFVPIPRTGRGRVSQRNSGYRPCYQEDYED